jgi:hypothetical protein
MVDKNSSSHKQVPSVTNNVLTAHADEVSVCYWLLYSIVWDGDTAAVVSEKEQGMGHCDT